MSALRTLPRRHVVGRVCLRIGTSFLIPVAIADFACLAPLWHHWRQNGLRKCDGGPLALMLALLPLPPMRSDGVICFSMSFGYVNRIFPLILSE